MSVKSFENGTMTLPAYCGKPSMPDRNGTEPGTVDAESMPMMPTMACAIYNQELFSQDRGWDRREGRRRLSVDGAGMA